MINPRGEPNVNLKNQSEEKDEQGNYIHDNVEKCYIDRITGDIFSLHRVLKCNSLKYPRMGTQSKRWIAQW